MKYQIENKNQKFAYLQLYEQLRNDIVSGVLPYDTKLPSKRLFAEETGVSVITVEHAYAILCDEGYIESKERSGYFVIYRESDFLSSPSTFVAKTPQSNEVKPKSAFPFSTLAKTMRSVLTEYGDCILTKSPNRGCLELREAISAYLARSSGMKVNCEQIIIGAGAEYLYSLIAQLFREEHTFALESPSYEKIELVYKSNGVKCDMLDMGNDGILSKELERTNATVLHITPFNSYPSQITASVSKRHEYLRFAEKKNGFIIEDNYAAELTVSKKNEDTVFSMCKNDLVIYLNTFSETVAPSFRIGYMVLPERLLEVFSDKLGFYSCTVPVFEQYVLAKLLENGDFERHINRVRREKRKSK